jgi:hypothetical protein
MSGGRPMLGGRRRKQSARKRDSEVSLSLQQIQKRVRKGSTAVSKAKATKAKKKTSNRSSSSSSSSSSSNSEATPAEVFGKSNKKATAQLKQDESEEEESKEDDDNETEAKFADYALVPMSIRLWVHDTKSKTLKFKQNIHITKIVENSTLRAAESLYDELVEELEEWIKPNAFNKTLLPSGIFIFARSKKPPAKDIDAGSSTIIGVSQDTWLNVQENSCVCVQEPEKQVWLDLLVLVIAPPKEPEPRQQPRTVTRQPNAAEKRYSLAITLLAPTIQTNDGQFRVASEKKAPRPIIIFDEDDSDDEAYTSAPSRRSKGYIVRHLKNAAIESDLYISSGEHCVGMHSDLFRIRKKNNSLAVVVANSEELWDYALSRRPKSGGTQIKIELSIGKMKANDVPFVSKLAFDENDEDRLFSQSSEILSPFQVIDKTNSLRAERASQQNRPALVRAFIGKCLETPDCELYNSLLQEHYDYLCKAWQATRIAGGIEWCFEKWGDDAGEWPKIGDLPETMRAGRDLEKSFERLPAETRKYPPHANGNLQTVVEQRPAGSGEAGGSDKYEALGNSLGRAFSGILTPTQNALIPATPAAPAAPYITASFKNVSTGMRHDMIGNPEQNLDFEGLKKSGIFKFPSAISSEIRKKEKEVRFSIGTLMFSGEQMKGFTLQQLRDAAAGGSSPIEVSITTSVVVDDGELEEIEI